MGGEVVALGVVGAHEVKVGVEEVAMAEGEAAHMVTVEEVTGEAMTGRKEVSQLVQRSCTDHLQQMCWQMPSYALRTKALMRQCLREFSALTSHQRCSGTCKAAFCWPKHHLYCSAA